MGFEVREMPEGFWRCCWASAATRGAGTGWGSPFRDCETGPADASWGQEMSPSAAAPQFFAVSVGPHRGCGGCAVDLPPAFPPVGLLQLWGTLMDLELQGEDLSC